MLRREFGSRVWFDAVCEMTHVRPRIVLESAAPDTVIALAAAGYGLGVIPTNVQLPPTCRAVPLVNRGTSVGKWAMIAWDSQRLLPPYAEQFANELVAHVRPGYPGQHLIRRAPPLEPVKQRGPG